MNLLDVVIFLPLIGFLIMLLIPRSNPSLVRTFAVAMALITFLVSIGLILRFQQRYYRPAVRNQTLSAGSRGTRTSIITSASMASACG